MCWRIICVSGSKKCQFFEKFDVRTKWMTPLQKLCSSRNLHRKVFNTFVWSELNDLSQHSTKPKPTTYFLQKSLQIWPTCINRKTSQWTVKPSRSWRECLRKGLLQTLRKTWCQWWNEDVDWWIAINRFVWWSWSDFQR